MNEDSASEEEILELSYMTAALLQLFIRQEGRLPEPSDSILLDPDFPSDLRDPDLETWGQLAETMWGNWDEFVAALRLIKDPIIRSAVSQWNLPPLSHE